LYSRCRREIDLLRRIAGIGHTNFSKTDLDLLVVDGEHVESQGHKKVLECFFFHFKKPKSWIKFCLGLRISRELASDEEASLSLNRLDLLGEDDDLVLSDLV